MKWLFSKCRRCEADLSLLAANALAEEERAGVETHLAGCPGCQARFAELKALTARLAQHGETLPIVEPPASLHRRVVAAVREDARATPEPAAPLVAVWFFGRRAVWGGLAVVWALIFLLRFSAPDAPAPTVAVAPMSLREVLLVLKTDRQGWPLRAEDGRKPTSKRPVPATGPPRSQRLPLRSTAAAEVA